MWALLDGKAGHNSQTLGIIDALGMVYDTKTLAFSHAASKPNIWPIHPLKRLEAMHEIQAPWPDVVISTGRRTAPIARYIKRQSPHTIIVQSMDPGIPRSAIDLLVLPMHDKAPLLFPKKRILRTLGAPHRVSAAALHDQLAIWKKSLPDLTSPVLTVLVGGSNAAGEMTPEMVAPMIEKMRTHQGTLLISVSRRTPNAVTEALKTAIVDHPSACLYDPAASPRSNPYFAFLAAAKEIWVTSESVNMLTEAASTNTTVRNIFMPELMRPKHTRMLEVLKQHNHVLELDDDASSTTPLSNPANAVTEKIRAILHI